MIVVSDTSPLSNLLIIGRLELLRDLYGAVLIPPAVAEEFRAGEQKAVQQGVLALPPWIEVRQVKDRSTVSDLLRRLDLGEAEAIVLASEAGADLLLIDERRGQEVAAKNGVRTVGLLGSLIAAKHKGLIKAVRPLVDDLIALAGFWIGSDLYEEVRKAAGE